MLVLARSRRRPRLRRSRRRTSATRRRAGSCRARRPSVPGRRARSPTVFVNALMSFGSSWPSYLPPSSIAFCAACGERHAAAAARHALVGDRVAVRAAAERLRRDLLQLLDARRSPRRAPRASSRASSGCRPTRTSTAGACDVLPQVTSTFSHGMPSISAATRCTSITDSVPRLPMPDWMYSRPSGLMTNRPSKPDRAGDERAHRDADAAHLRCRRAGRSAPCARPT